MRAPPWREQATSASTGAAPPVFRFGSEMQPQKERRARHKDNKDENDCAPHILSLRHRSNPLSGSERDRHPNQTENGKGKCIISSERRRPKRMGVQSKPDNCGHDKSK